MATEMELSELADTASSNLDNNAPRGVRELEAVAHTRLRVTLADLGRFDEAAAKLAGVAAVMKAAPGVVHLIVGEQAGRLAAVMKVA